tara:strand:- start:1418 stop:3367 length:1950 start_codon:yes stop_codon:yes gene_type:complete
MLDVKWIEEQYRKAHVVDELLPIREFDLSKLSGSTSLIDEFNSQHSVDTILLRNGYEAIGDRFLAPGSTSGIPGVLRSLECNDGRERVYSNHGNDPLNDDYSHDPFDCYRILECEGDFKRALNSLKPGGSTTVIDAIYQSYAAQLNVAESALSSKLLVNEGVVTSMVISSLHNPHKNKISFLNQTGWPVQYTEADAKKFLVRAFGSICNQSVLGEFIDEYFTRTTEEFTPAQRKKKEADIRLSAINVVVDEIKYSNQRTKIEVRCDMFAESSSIEIKPTKALITLKPVPIKYKADGVDSTQKKSAVSDYKAHCYLLDVILDFIVAARFAPDRKNAFLWLRCDSDWGKNFLIDCFKKLGTVLELSVKELEKMFDGSPVGRTIDEFAYTFMLVFDEVKYVKAEIKQLSNRALFAPKFESTYEAEIFSKILLSAENIASLAGEQGAEAQFINRFNKIDFTGSLNNRSLFKKIGKGAYHDSVTEYIAEQLSQRIQSYISMGKMAAQKRATEFLDEFHEEHSLGKHVHSIDEIVDEIAEEIRTLIFKYYEHNARLGRGRREIDMEDYNGYSYSSVQLLASFFVDVSVHPNRKSFVLKSSSRFIEHYIQERASHSGKGSLNYKITQIAETIGEVGLHWATISGEKKRIRGVLVKK